MKCPCCGAAELIHDTRDMPYTYKGKSTTIPTVTGDFCPVCGEVVLNRGHGDRYSEMLGQLQRQVNATYVDPAYIATVRKRLDLELSALADAAKDSADSAGSSIDEALTFVAASNKRIASMEAAAVKSAEAAARASK